MLRKGEAGEVRLGWLGEVEQNGRATWGMVSR